MRHFGNVGGFITKLAGAYNQTVTSMNTRLVPQVRRIQTLGRKQERTAALKPVETTVVEPETGTAT